jgi:SNF family Na+-dependent transporter
MRVLILPELSLGFTALCTQSCCIKKKQTVAIVGIRCHFVSAVTELLEMKICTFPAVAVLTH